METIVKEDNWRKDEKECIHKSNQQLTKNKKMKMIHRFKNKKTKNDEAIL